MMANKITYFSVDQYGIISTHSEWDALISGREAAVEFFHNEPHEVLDALGISLVTDPYPETKINHPVEEANAIAKTRALPYRFGIEFWISGDEAVSEFLDAIDISYYGVIEEVLRTNHGMTDADDNAIRQVIIDPDFDREFDIEFHDQVRKYITGYSVDRHEVDEMSGTWGYYLIDIDNDLSKVKKETKDLIMSITEKVLATIKKKGRKQKKK
jgi:hypothetical protein